jgi:NADPH2:quinone reductase
MGAAMMIQGLTAVVLTRLAYEIKPGDVILVHAAAGGTGRMIVQMAKYLKATVIGTTSTSEKAMLAQKAGCDHVILYKEDNVLEKVMNITKSKGVNAVYDGVGKSTFDLSLSCLARFGTMLSFGNASGKVDDIPIMKLVPRAIKLCRPSLFEFIKTQQDFDICMGELEKAMNEANLDFHIHHVYDLENVGQAQTELEQGKTAGKLLLKI